MEQYSTPNEGSTAPPKPAPDRELKTLESQVTDLLTRVSAQEKEINRLQRELTRLKNSVDSVIAVVKQNV
jgi:peptidoglycan hydrolase CwlO-like protein